MKLTLLPTYISVSSRPRPHSVASCRTVVPLFCIGTFCNTAVIVRVAFTWFQVVMDDGRFDLIEVSEGVDYLHDDGASLFLRHQLVLLQIEIEIIPLTELENSAESRMKTHQVSICKVAKTRSSKMHKTDYLENESVICLMNGVDFNLPILDGNIWLSSALNHFCTTTSVWVDIEQNSIPDIPLKCTYSLQILSLTVKKKNPQKYCFSLA